MADTSWNHSHLSQSNFPEMPPGVNGSQNFNYSVTFHVDSTSQATQRNGSEESVYLPWDNPWNVISYQTYRDIITAVQLYLVPPIFLVGISTNIINCIVFFRQSLKDRMNLCLFCLALADLCYLLCAAVASVEHFIRLVDPVLAQELEVKRQAYLTCSELTFQAISNCITLVIAIERCLCVLFPLKASNLMSTKTMAIIILAIVVVVQIAYLTFPLRLTARRITDNSGQVRWLLRHTKWDSSREKIVKALFVIVFSLVLQTIVPMLIMLIVAISTGITIVRLKTALAKRLTMSSINASEFQLQHAAVTKVLIMVCCVFIACYTPKTILSFVRNLVPEFHASGRYFNIFHTTHTIANQVFAVLNSSINFFVFLWRSSKYRSVLGSLFCGGNNAWFSNPKRAELSH